MKNITQKNMKTFTVISGLAIATTAMTASADVLLCVDLSVTDQITITATDGLSAGDAFGTEFTGVLLTDFFTLGPGLFETGVGDLVATGDSPDGSPGLFNDPGSAGLNFYSWTSDQFSGFFTGTLAFTGEATWELDSDDYAAALAGNIIGDINAFADTDDDIPSSTFIGTWEVKVPAPGSMSLLGLGGILVARRRR